VSLRVLEVVEALDLGRALLVVPPELLVVLLALLVLLVAIW
jgi:hypothetical protein